MQPRSTEGVGGVSDERLRAVASTLPYLPNIYAEYADRLTQSVRSLAEKRAQDGWPNEGEQDVAAFVLVDHPRQTGEQHQAQPFADLIAKDDPLLGNLFFTNPDASAGRVMQMPVTDPNDILEWLEDNGLGLQPSVLVYRNQKIMITRRDGADGRVQHDPIRDHPPSATQEELLEALEFFHTKHLLTPVCCISGVWEKERAHEYVPGPEPEKKIQSGLGLALGSWFHGVVRVEFEDTTNIGRIDVRLLTKDGQGGSLKYWRIIELKVIKSFRNASKGNTPSAVSISENVQIIVDGIQQAWTYKENRGTKIGLLEIFDLRKQKKDLMDHTKIQAAIKLAPRLVRNTRLVFGSSKDARTAGFTGN